jgi:tRNA(Arg) A34 adenosine deaminase TadA
MALQAHVGGTPLHPYRVTLDPLRTPYRGLQRHMAITPRDSRIINKLLALSRELDNGLRCRHFSALYLGKRLISLAHNQPISDTFHYRASGKQTRQFRHSETAAIKQIQFRDDLSEMTLYVARADLTGKSAESRPCPDCSKAIKEAGIKRVIYSIKNGIKEGI